jgi:hypothetical protein
MADKKISQLTAATTPLAGTEEVALTQGGETRRTAVANIGVTTLAGLSDVDIPSPNDGEVLTYDDATNEWIAAPGGAGTLSALTDVNIPSPSDGEVLTYDNATSKWIAAATQVPANVIVSDTTGVAGADAITNIISLTQAEYNAITPNASTLYVITA